MAEYNRFIGNYERIPYNSFVWKFGTTSFRTREFNRMTEWQLQLLDDFWKKPENRNQGWEKKYMAPGKRISMKSKIDITTGLLRMALRKGMTRYNIKQPEKRPVVYMIWGLLTRTID